jgi:hypothetical protein
MWRWARWVLLTVGVIILAATGKHAWTDHQKRIVWRQQETVFASELAEMQRAFPIGTQRSAVLSELRLRYPQFAIGDSTQDVQVWLGKEPSFVWYCNFMTPFVQFTFQGGGSDAPLVKIERETTGECL